MNITIQGNRAVRRAMRRMEGPQILRASKRGLRSGAKLTRARAQLNAPKDTELLMRSIVNRVGRRNFPGRWAINIQINAKATAELHRRSGTVAYGSRRHRSGKGAVGTDYYYPAAQEFGWTREGQYHPGKPYLRRAFDETQAAAGLIIQETIWREIVQQYGRG